MLFQQHPPRILAMPRSDTSAAVRCRDADGETLETIFSAADEEAAGRLLVHSPRVPIAHVDDEAWPPSTPPAELSTPEEAWFPRQTLVVIVVLAILVIGRTLQQDLQGTGECDVLYIPKHHHCVHGELRNFASFLADEGAKREHSETVRAARAEVSQKHAPLSKELSKELAEVELRAPAPVGEIGATELSLQSAAPPTRTRTHGHGPERG